MIGRRRYEQFLMYTFEAFIDENLDLMQELSKFALKVILKKAEIIEF